MVELAGGRIDEVDVLGQERAAKSRMRMPLTSHERMFARTGGAGLSASPRRGQDAERRE